MTINKSKYIGLINYNTNGDKMIITEYKGSKNITVLFDNGLSVKSRIDHFREGCISNFTDKIQNKIGEIRYNKYGSKMEIIKYINKTTVMVKFEDGYTTESQYGHFKNGGITNPYDKSVVGIGFIGEGDYIVSKDGIHKNSYTVWSNMLKRCYDETTKINYPSYKNCSVDETWFNYQEYAKWYEENYYKFDNERMEVDKDILRKRNKVYSPNTCIFVPQFINTLFTKSEATRGDCVIGVTYRKYKNINPYCSQCYYFGKNVHLGEYNTEIQAFNSYKIFKEKYIKEVADKYKDKIPLKLYEALYDYKVEITD